MCFSDWPLGVVEYKTPDFKSWYKFMKESLNNERSLMEFWIKSNDLLVTKFLKDFIAAFNEMAERQNADPIPDMYIQKIE